MSAIAGFMLLDGATASIDTIKTMLAHMKHYGPDHQAFTLRENVAFGHALLATTPEALHEAQPWCDEASGCVVVSDSRLDNRESLAAEVGLGGRAVDTIGDGELIFASYQKWGEACPEKLLGDFAFAVWNPRSKQLFCARDQLGVRPFYYHFVPNKLFAFASTSEALRDLLQKPVALDEGRVADALTDELEGHDSTSTFFRDIKRLVPAHWLSLQHQSSPFMQCYWQPQHNPPSPFPETEKQWLEQLKALFIEAVHCRLRSHLPISSMLSGGLDSSAIVAVACEKLKHDNKPRLSTFSAISSDTNCAETRAIALMQSTFELTSTNIDPEKSPELIQAIANQWPLMDEPFEAPNTLVHAQYLAARQANRRIMLDGIDADALFSEADFLHDLARAGQWRKVWQECRAASRFWGKEASLGYFLRPLVSEFLAPKSIRRSVRYLRGKYRSMQRHKHALISPEFAQQVDLQARFQTMASNTAGLKFINQSGQTAYSVMAGSNSANAIERYHRLAGRHGIEPRHPFLDRRLVEFCASLPLELRLRHGYPKWVLRQAMSTILPKEIAWRRGKEHLGWLFNKALWLQSGKALTAAPLHPLLKRAVVDTAQARYRELTHLEDLKAVNENHVEDLLKLAALSFWLNKPGQGERNQDFGREN